MKKKKKAESVLAFDKASGRIVHVTELPEGYRECSCCGCKAKLVTANRNPNSRKKAMYFRHQNGASCGLETALHSFAKQVILESACLHIPSFDALVTIPRRAKDTRTYEQRMYIPGELTTLKDLAQERKYPGSNRIADVVATDDHGTIFIEIRVSHEVDKEKLSELHELQQDCIEIDLHALIDRPELTVEEIRSAVLETAPRKWLTHPRFRSPITSVKLHLEARRRHDLKELEKQRAQRKNQKHSLRDEHADLIGLIKCYQDIAQQQKARIHMQRRLLKAGTNENTMREKVISIHHRIPTVVDVPVNDELAFRVHRLYWQALVIAVLQCNYWNKPVARWSSAPSVTPERMYRNIGGSSLLTRIGQESENIVGRPVKSTRSSVKELRFLSVKEFEALPKPVAAIRQYFNALVDVEALEKLSGDTYQIGPKRNLIQLFPNTSDWPPESFLTPSE